MRLIDADALFEHKVYAETPTISGDFVPGFVIDRAPTIDAVPVVRCKDCHFWTPSGVFGEYVIGGVYEYGRCPYFSETRECFYCQYGQKRTSNEEATK